MKKIAILPIIAAGAIALTSCNSGSTPKATLKTTVDSVSYAIGINTGLGYKQNLESFPGEPANIDDMIAGFAEGLKGNPSMTQEEAMNIIQTYFQNAEKIESEKNLAEGKKFLEENAKKEGVITTESGLQYKVDSLGTGATPKAEDVVKVHYTGTLLDGTKFDSSVDRGEPATFGVNQVIPGWTEGLQLMPVGSKYTFYIPSELAYGERAAGQAIKPNSTLVFQVELISIEEPQKK
ncbi:MAG: FKBP-type peptidyl-prolyl cis-trans isomerase [Bacteroidales bacterium]|nr:FKBP-type peptidyl-prolyl cis-trans isomerase [Bacteroidales bacterium]